MATKARAGPVKVSVLQASLAGNAVLLVLSVGLGWRLAGAAPRCELKQVAATGEANVQIRKEESKRDEKLDAATNTAKAETRKEVSKAQEQTRARAETIDRIPVDGSCRRPDGLPDLGPAVDQANAAAGD